MCVCDIGRENTEKSDGETSRVIIKVRGCVRRELCSQGKEKKGEVKLKQWDMVLLLAICIIIIGTT